MKIVARALLSAIALVALASTAHAQSLQVVGYAGVLGEWELTATVTQAAPQRDGEFSGAVTMTHVGICTQDGPEQRSGEIRLRMSSSLVNATLSLAGVECKFSGRMSDAYKGQMSCADRPALPLALWVR